jgi:FtsP/CotA-like multicopper oxidase with cupredoxin domain
MLLPLAADGQTTCPTINQDQELVNPPELKASGGVLKTTFDVQEKTFCIPSTEIKKDGKGTGVWQAAPLKLRTYIYPNPVNGQPAWGLPGPTLRLRKAPAPGGKGDALEVLLKNNLPFPSDSGACDSSCAAGTTCDCSPGALGALMQRCIIPDPVTGRLPAECCCVVNCTQKSPSCQHGDNVTNLHFHGSHASPQAPQDFVLLDLYPPKPAGAQSMEHASHGDAGKVAYGQYQYRVEPFGWMQAEGSHWYHPHKHGSTGLQVANGMAGAMLIRGPFDDWLEQFYNPETGDKVMVIQSVAEDAPLFTPGAGAGQILVNGMIKPKITVKPGEIQRWRFINATMSSRTLLNITFPPGLVFRQVAMDGVRFSPVNYECQPLINFNQNNPNFTCNPNPTGNPTVRIAPGNRADFLVLMPMTETPKGKEGLRVERKLINIQGEERGQRKVLLQRDEAMAPGAAEPALFTVFVDDGIKGNDSQPKKLAANAPKMPTALPPMPDYLSNITDDEVKGNDVKMTFQQFLADSKTQQWPYAASPLASFKIDGRQFDATCANVTTKVETAAQWTVSNATLLPHPFHIHTNPFQVFSVKGVPVRAGTTKPEPEPFWMDTLTLPVATVVPATAPANPTSPIQITTASFVIRQRYREFTGDYVLHCHFLGHEDRGMMFSVQTVCKDKPDFYGKANQPQPECSGELLPAVPACQ